MTRAARPGIAARRLPLGRRRHDQGLRRCLRKHGLSRRHRRRICGPELEAASGLASGSDFFLGYAPERVNPGDREHRIERIVKVVSGCKPPRSARFGGRSTGRSPRPAFTSPRTSGLGRGGEGHRKRQRDINIAFVNEVAQILSALDISVHDVLETAGTKWNFLDFRPGLVGGHCIGVDPYYLAHLATSVGHEPEVILAGRRINDGMGTFIAERIAESGWRPSDPAAGTSPRPGPRPDFQGGRPGPQELAGRRSRRRPRRPRPRGSTCTIPWPAPRRPDNFTAFACSPTSSAAAGYDCVVAAVAHARLSGLHRPDPGPPGASGRPGRRRQGQVARPGTCPTTGHRWQL